jgi:hypothetical protein
MDSMDFRPLQTPLVKDKFWGIVDKKRFTATSIGMEAN